MDGIHIRTLVYRVRGIDHEQRKVPMLHQYDINTPARGTGLPHEIKSSTHKNHV